MPGLGHKIIRLHHKYRLWWPLIVGFTVLGFVFLAGISGYMLLEGWNLLESFYMVVITLATVGYQEVRPLSPMGRLFTAGLILCGVGGFAYLVGSFTQLLVEGNLQQLLGKRRMQKMIQKLSGHYIVCGYGRIGSIVAQQILREGHPVVVIEKEQATIEKLEAEGVMHIAGDATSDDVLLSAGLMRASSLITALLQDAANVYVTLTARQLNPNLTIIARADNESHIARLERAGADRVVLPHIIGGVRMAQTVLRPTVTNLLELAQRGNLELQMEELPVLEGAPFAGANLKDSGIRPRFDVIVISVKKENGEMIFNPGPLTVIEPGDTLVVMGRPDHMRELRAISAGQGH